MTQLTKTFALFTVLFPFISGCSSQPVQAWQKQDLSRLEMQFESNTVQSGFEQHFYFSKEGSSGGEGFAGGGCGCN